MNTKRIVIDGKIYNNVEEMPEGVRRQYEDAMSSLKGQFGDDVQSPVENIAPLADRNRNGIPDIVEGTPGASIIQNVLKVMVNGQEFNNLDELPPEARARYAQAMKTLDANGNQIPDFMESMMPQSASAPVKSEYSTSAHAPRQAIPVAPTIEPDSPNRLLLILLAGLLFFLCAAAGAGIWYFFLR